MRGASTLFSGGHTRSAMLNRAPTTPGTLSLLPVRIANHSFGLFQSVQPHVRLRQSSEARLSFFIASKVLRKALPCFRHGRLPQ
jgi:hypothetical protein